MANKKKVSATLVRPAPAQIGAGEFKARCLELMDLVKKTGAALVITKRGKPVARLVPVQPTAAGAVSAFGALKGSFEILGDIVGPAADPEDFSFDARNL